MLKLNAKIRVYETISLIPTPKFYEFNYVKNVEISSSYKSLTDTAVIVMPQKVYTDTKGFDQNLFANASGKEQSIYDFFKLENFIEIFLGYDGDYKPAFRGYITGVQADINATISCEDMMYALKKIKAVDDDNVQDQNDLYNTIAVNPTTNVENFNPKTFFEKRIKELKLPIKLNALNEELGNIMISRNHTLAQVFEMLKEKGIFTYFKIEATGPVLTITNNPQEHTASELVGFVDRNFIKSPLAGSLVKKLINQGLDLLSSQLSKATQSVSDVFSGKVRFRFRYNIIEDKLVAVNESAKNTRTRVEKYFKNSNTPIYIELGDPNGQLIKTHVLHNDTDELPKDPTAFKKAATEAASELYQYGALRAMQSKPNGFEGSFLTFGEPFVRPTDKVVLENAKDKQKNGTFQVEKVERSYGVNGYRQRIYIGRRVVAI
ncbi:hypothetical protein [Flavobacterium reichenbachii]|uniref:Phage protein D n=1 Tax=Flavobacterium reichenbachii TaxID=362418 RepID=A0A085ZPQ1_9FLAO|nr:hypothetical protein [Flavobacterium reichenbachii]KFF06415.1 hypothetical protein IW19_13240 [Flavobacterium reichenbachii]OXB14602.1 hypothetical protein B0A68_12235 [Flavobacterium reichenbachii]